MTDIGYEKCNFYFHVLRLFDIEVETIATRRWHEGQLIMNCAFHDQDFLQFICFNDAIYLIFVIISESMKVRGQLYSFHKNGERHGFVDSVQ